jgi:two-component system sensor histidine kinase RegB
VDNARDASSARGPVVLRVDGGAGHVRFEVQDQGHGMVASVLARVGEPFFTTKPAGRGTGLGVFLARSFAERWSGTLTLQSTEGVGTRATLELPLPPRGAAEHG